MLQLKDDNPVLKGAGVIRVQPVCEDALE